MIAIHVPFTPDDKTAGQAIHVRLSPIAIHVPFTPFTPDGETAGQAIHAVNHATHAAVIHETHHPFRGGVSHDREGGAR
jgi:hypothetical protein